VFTLALASPSAWGNAYVSFDFVPQVDFPPGNCEAMGSGPSVTITTPSSCTAGAVTFAASATGWAAFSMDAGVFIGQYAGSVFTSASFDPTAVILGGTGSGFFEVEYTDTLRVANIFSLVTASAGDLTDNCLCQNDNVTDTIWSGWIPFVFGEEVSLPQMSVSYQADVEEGPADFTLSETVTAFDILDANMNPLPLAQASQTPEPSALYLSAAGIILLTGFRRYKHRQA